MMERHERGGDAEPQRAVRPPGAGRGAGADAVGRGDRCAADRRGRRRLPAGGDPRLRRVAGRRRGAAARSLLGRPGLVCGAGRPLWNHGGSGDDLARPGLVSLPAPASTYFHGAVDEAAASRVGRLLVARGAGPFARAVAEGAVARASAHDLDARTVGAGSLAAEDAAGDAVLVVGRFEEDVAQVRLLRGRARGPALLGAVAAGLPAFGELGAAADGVLGPVQWWPTSRTPQVGPPGADFAAGYRRRVGHVPFYVAAQAAAAGYLALAAHGLGLAVGDLPGWRTSTLLGDFALGGSWRQVGHRVTTIRWRDGRMVPLVPRPGAHGGLD